MKLNYLDNPIVGYYNNGMAVSVNSLTCNGKKELDADYKPIYLFDYLGRRIYRHSLCFLFCYAAYLAYPERIIKIGHSLGDGFYFSFTDGNEISEDETAVIEAKMNELIAQNNLIECIKLNYDDAIAFFRKQNMYSTELLLSYKNEPEVNLYKINDYYDVAYEPLVPCTSVLSKWQIKKYANGVLLRYPISSDISCIQEFKDNPNLFKVFDEYKKWGKLLKVSCLGELNSLVAHGNISQYIRLSEALHRRKLADVADEIAERKSTSVFISGPSSSGKTTFSIKLCEQLMLMGYCPVRISLDNYYKPRNEIPLDESGNIDYECLEALYLDMFKENINNFYSGREVALPVWSFSKQERTYPDPPIKKDDKTILIIEGIHALNPKINGFISKESVFKIYISALTQLNLDTHNRISTTDNRILRRILRDFRTRSVSASETLSMWSSVERGERKHIFPYQNLADVNFNSASDYELCVIAPMVIPLLKEIKVNSGISYTMARRLLAFLENFYPIPESVVPSDSILREFIGNSDYGAV